jgi:hypothetical protein
MLFTVHPPIIFFNSQLTGDFKTGNHASAG